MSKANDISATSSVRYKRDPVLPRKVWVLSGNEKRTKTLMDAINAGGHRARTGEPGSDLAPALREFRPDMIVIDMMDEPDRGRHVAQQLRADRSTRQLPIVMTSVSPGEESTKTDSVVTGPTRRYVVALDAPSVISAILAEL